MRRPRHTTGGHHGTGRSVAGRAPVAGWVAALVLGLAGLAACSSGGDESGSDSTATTTTAEATTTTEEREVDPAREPGECPTEDEVAELLGGPVERTQSFGGGLASSLGGESLSYSYEGCAYELTDGGQGEVSVERVSTEEDLGGVSLYERIEAVARDDAEERGFTHLDDLGEDAYREGRRVVVLTEEAMIFVSYDDAEGEEDFEPVVPLAEALLELDLTASEDPDCDDVETAVTEAAGEEAAQSIRSGGFIGVNDVEITTTGCNVELVSGAEADVAVADPASWDAWVEAKGASGFTAVFEEASIGEQRAFDDGEALIVDDGDLPLRITAEGDDLQPDTAAVRLALAELTLLGA